MVGGGPRRGGCGVVCLRACGGGAGYPVGPGPAGGARSVNVTLAGRAVDGGRRVPDRARKGVERAGRASHVRDLGEAGGARRAVVDSAHVRMASGHGRPAAGGNRRRRPRVLPRRHAERRARRRRAGRGDVATPGGVPVPNQPAEARNHELPHVRGGLLPRRPVGERAVPARRELQPPEGRGPVEQQGAALFGRLGAGGLGLARGLSRNQRLAEGLAVPGAGEMPLRDGVVPAVQDVRRGPALPRQETGLGLDGHGDDQENLDLRGRHGLPVRRARGDGPFRAGIHDAGQPDGGLRPARFGGLAGNLGRDNPGAHPSRLRLDGDVRVGGRRRQPADHRSRRA